MKTMRQILTTLLLLISTNTLALPINSRVPGGVAVIPLADAKQPAPKATFRNKPVLIIKEKNKWVALVGLPLNLKPGPYQLDTNFAEQKFKVAAKKYPEQRVTIKDKRKVEPNLEDMARINREQPLIEVAKNHWADNANVDIDLMLPAEGPLSSRFGLRRIFNGQPRNPHSGLDVAVPTGTPVLASANGTVINTGDYFFNGNTVFVDHGQGLITLYCHLSDIAVKPGDTLTRGQLLGASGMTGRASGPHLHWSVIMNGTMIDPEIFVRPREQ